jgi:long-subunit acyl-CoA synthetase (AMP-forming)
MDIIHDTKMELLICENELLKNKVNELEERIKKYTNSDAHKKYYEEHKDEVKKQGKAYLEKLKQENPDKLKEYRHTAYLNRKNKLKQNIQSDNISN